MRKGSVFTAVVLGGAVAWGQAPVEKAGGRIDLPSSKGIAGVVPGRPQPLSSTPVAIAVSPDGRYAVTVNGGYGSFESGYDQALAVIDTRTGAVEEFPDPRTLTGSGQVLFSGLAFSADGRRLYGTIVSESDPEGKKDGDTGSGIQVYGFAEGKITRERVIKIPMQKLAPGKTTKLGGGGREDVPKDATLAIPYPAAIAVIPGASGTQVADRRPGAPGVAAGERLLVADNLSDDVLLINAENGAIERRFDVSESDTVPGTYPASAAVAKDGKRAFVGLWNSSELVELDLVSGTVGRKLTLLKADSEVKPSSHPTALTLSPDGQTLYVALGNRDAVAAVDLSGGGARGGFRLKGYFDTRLPGQSFYGALPEALAVNGDGSRLFCADLGSDAVAVLDTTKLTKGAVAKGMVEPEGFIPTEWMPTGVAFSGGKILIASGKGTGTGPNNFPQRTTEATGKTGRYASPSTYIAALLHGSIAVVDEKTAERERNALTAEVLEDNRMKAAEERIAWSPGVMASLDRTHEFSKGKTQVSEARPGAPGKVGGVGSSGPIRHVIYVIKENRTYDQVLGDLAMNGKPVGNGDPSLTMYGAEVTPNLHRLALRFGVLDNFYDSGEVSGDGHVWTTAAINSDYNERTWQLNYRGRQHGYDYEGVVSQGIPLEQHIPDVAEPGTGYVWGNAEVHGWTHYNFGEFISSTFCAAKGTSIAQSDSRQGPLLEGKTCAQRNEVKPGEKLPAEWGGGENKWPWAIPLLQSNHATKPELVGHFAPESPDFNLRVPDQIRVNVFARHLAGWIAERKGGADTMPNFITMRLGNDHTAGTTPGGPTPKASVADNDLAVGRIVELVSQSEFWDDTAICVLEDDAQNGADHVDAHRSLALVISKYAPRTGAGPFVDSRFYSTVSMVRTTETLLGLPPMNNNDAFAPLIGSVFTGAGDQPAYAADRSNETNGLIYTANAPGARGGHESSRMDFTHEDRAPAEKLNVILWQDARPEAPVPAQLTARHRKLKGDDVDQ